MATSLGGDSIPTLKERVYVPLRGNKKASVAGYHDCNWRLLVETIDQSVSHSVLIYCSFPVGGAFGLVYKLPLA